MKPYFNSLLILANLQFFWSKGDNTENFKSKIDYFDITLMEFIWCIKIYFWQNYQFCSIEKGQAEPVEADSLKRELLDTNRCYILDCGFEVFVWMGRNTSLDERKSASGVADVTHFFISII